MSIKNMFIIYISIRGRLYIEDIARWREDKLEEKISWNLSVKMPI